MAWELQRHMHSWVAPSVWKAMQEHSFSRAHRWWWLAQVYADQRWDEDTGDEGYAALRSEALGWLKLGCWDLVIHAIADFAIENGAAQKGGHGVYLDRQLWARVPWCSEDEQQAWFA